MKLKAILSFFILIKVMDIYACSFSTSASGINIGVSLDQKNYFSYTNKTTLENVPFFEINNCSTTAAKGKFLMLTFGPEVVDIVDNDRGVNFNKQYNEPEYCSLSNNPLEKKTIFEDRKRAFDNKWKLINKCIKVTVKDMGQRPLSFSKIQEGCEVISNSSSSATFMGGYCFFKPDFDSNYNVMLSISNECLNLNGFKNTDINLQDINADLSVYTSATDKDDLEDLVALGSSAVRFSINPHSSVLKPSDDFGVLRPTFPAIYQLNDLHVGKLLFDSQSDTTVKVHVPFIVDNARCTIVKSNGIQSSACDYATPFVATITLKDAHGKEVLTWQDGGVAPANWQGILSGEGFKIDKELFPGNKKYSLEIDFSDPHFAFNTFKNRLTKKIGHLNVGIPEFGTGGSINDINDIQGMPTIDDMVLINTVSDISFNNPKLNLSSSHKRLNSYFSSSLFPPSYEKTCNNNKVCVEVSKSFVKFIATFKVDEDYEISDIEISRVSKLLSPYKRKINEQPEYICE